ncbi:MAG TPA: hypothetical protein VFZ03_10590 [Dongiaceae bacterium]
MRGELDTENLGMTLFFGGFIPTSLVMLVNPTAWRLRHAVRNPNVPVKITRSWVVTVGILIGALLMTSASVYALVSSPADDPSRGLAIFGLVVCPVAGLGAVLMQVIVALTLSPEGLDFSAFKCGPIAWSDISAVYVQRMFRTYVVAVEVRDEEKYIARGFRRPGLRWRWTRFFSPSLFSLPSAMFDVSPEWLRRAIQIRLDHFAAAGQSRPPMVQRQG